MADNAVAASLFASHAWSGGRVANPDTGSGRAFAHLPGQPSVPGTPCPGGPRSGVPDGLNGQAGPPLSRLGRRARRMAVWRGRASAVRLRPAMEPSCGRGPRRRLYGGGPSDGACRGQRRLGQRRLGQPTLFFFVACTVLASGGPLHFDVYLYRRMHGLRPNARCATQFGSARAHWAGKGSVRARGGSGHMLSIRMLWGNCPGSGPAAGVADRPTDSVLGFPSLRFCRHSAGPDGMLRGPRTDCLHLLSGLR